MTFFLIILFSIAFTFLAAKRPAHAVALVCFSLLSYGLRFQAFGIPATILELMICLLFVIWVIDIFRKKQWHNITFSNYKWLLLAFLIFSFFSIFLSVNKVAALGQWKAYFLEPIMFFLVFINTIKKRAAWNLVLGALGASALVVSIFAVVQHFTSWRVPVEYWNVADQRVTSWFSYPNAVGLYLAPIAVAFWGILLKSKVQSPKCKVEFKVFQFKMRIPDLRSLIFDLAFPLLIITTSLAAMYFAKSEGALIGTIVACVLLTLFLINWKLRIALAICLLFGTCFLLFNPTTNAYLKEKLLFRDLSGQIRVQMWHETWKMLMDGDHIIYGAGLANYQATIKPYHQEGIFVRDFNDPDFQRKVMYDREYHLKAWQPVEIYLYPHNFIFTFWSEIGFFGLLTFLLIEIKFLLNYLRVRNDENKRLYLILIAAMLALLIHGLVDVPYFKNDLAVLFWVLIGLGVSLRKLE